MKFSEKPLLKYAKVAFLISVLILSGVVPVITYNTNIFKTREDKKVAVVMFGASYEEQTAYNIFSNSKIIFDSFINMDITEIKKSLYAYTDIFFIGHGSDDGFKRNGNVINYDFISDTYQGKNLYFIACNSLQKNNNNDIISFPNNIDAIQAASYAIMNFALSYLKVNLALRMFKLLVNREKEIQSGSTPLFLDTTESGEHVAIRDEYRTKSQWGIPYYWEHILWINGANSYGYALAGAVTTGGSQVAQLEFVELIAAEIVGVSAGVIGAIIVLVALAISTGIILNMGNREDGDFMIGIGASLPASVFTAWVDNGDDGHGSDWKKGFPISVPFIGVPAWFTAISPIPSSWVTIIDGGSSGDPCDDLPPGTPC